jgi:hypothetical protein
MGETLANPPLFEAVCEYHFTDSTNESARRREWRPVLYVLAPSFPAAFAELTTEMMRSSS